MNNFDLFGDAIAQPGADEVLADGVLLLRGFAHGHAPALISAIQKIAAQAPFRHLLTPGGQRMSVAMTNAGSLGWISDRHGYRYAADDPLSGEPWPVMPALWKVLAQGAAARAGFVGFEPDACLINRYEVGARMALHQDRDECDFGAPIVSISLGLPVMFQFGGFERGVRPARIPLAHGDVVVWGGPARLRFHGVMPLKPGNHALLGESRINLTFRRAG